MKFIKPTIYAIMITVSAILLLNRAWAADNVIFTETCNSVPEAELPVSTTVTVGSGWSSRIILDGTPDATTTSGLLGTATCGSTLDETNDGFGYIMSPAPTTDEYYVDYKFIDRGSVAAAAAEGALLNFIDGATDYYYACYTDDDASGAVDAKIAKISSGGNSILSQSLNIARTLNNDTIECRIDYSGANPVITMTDITESAVLVTATDSSSPLAKTKAAGIFTGSTPTATGDDIDGQLGFDNIRLVEVLPPNPPTITVSTADTPDPVNRGSDVTFQATATDAEGDQWYLAVCTTAAVTAGTPPACDAGAYCVSSSAVNSGSSNSCSWTSDGSGAQNWYAFACDNNASPTCTSTPDTANSPVTVVVPTEFTAIVDPDNGANTDFTSLEAWQEATKGDLTAAATKVFSISASAGWWPVGADVTGANSGATASTTYISSSSQILLYNISGIFENGEVVELDGATGNNATLSSTGTPAVAVAKCRSTGGSVDDQMAFINGWTTDEDHYVKIWADPEDPYGRHDGTVNGGGYTMRSTDSSDYTDNILIGQPFTVVDGIKIIRTDDNWPYGSAIYLDQGYNAYGSIIRNNLLIQESGGDYGNLFGYSHNAFYTGGVRFYNNFIISLSGGTGSGVRFAIDGAGSDNKSFFVNNTIFGQFANEAIEIEVINTGSDTYKPLVYNNYVANTGSGIGYRFTSQYSSAQANFKYNYSNDTTAGTNNNNGQITLDQANFKNTNDDQPDLHITAESPLKNRGLSTPFYGDPSTAVRFQDDIDGTARGWGIDIGADEVPVEFVSTICENKNAGGDCANKDYNALWGWNNAFDVGFNLSATTTRVFSGFITGSLSHNAILNVCDGSTDTGIDVTVEATTSDQIIVEDVTGTTSPLIVSSGWTFHSGNCATGNYWTVSGSGDGLGASAILTAKIDGAWSGADDGNVWLGSFGQDSDNYVRIYTTPTARHQGYWDDTKYRIKESATNNTDYCVRTDDGDIWIDGLQCEITNNDYNYTEGIIVWESDEDDVIRISNNIISGVYSSTNEDSLFGIITNTDGTPTTYYVWNNIVYGIDPAGVYWGSVGIILYGRAYVYNNTVYDSNYCYRVLPNTVGDIIFANNIAQKCNGDYYESSQFDSHSVYNLTDISPGSSDAPPANAIYSATVEFVSTSTGVFRLADSDTAARDQGFDITSSSTLNVVPGITADYDGDRRPYGSAWDIGADEWDPPTAIYRSVGPDQDYALQCGGGANAMNITSTSSISNFQSPISNEIGVGDVIVYNSSSTIAFISGRNSNTNYDVRNFRGASSSPASFGDTGWCIFRAYDEIQHIANYFYGNDENDGLPNAVENFDTFTIGRDLVANNEQWNIACYAGIATDTDGIALSDDWQTGSSSYLKIYTPTEPREVGISQRHSGKWSYDKYRLTHDSGANIEANTSGYIKIIGLQVDTHNTYCVSAAGVTNLDLSDNILQGNGNNFGILTYSNYGKIYNNIIYGFTQSGSSRGIFAGGGTSNFYIYNNTVYDCSIGIESEHITNIASNNIVQNTSGNAFTGSFSDISGYNISDDATYASSTSDDISASVDFVSTTAGSEDFHLASTDTTARDQGTDLSSDPYISFSTDIDGNTRPFNGVWDIGADEFTAGYDLPQCRTGKYRGVTVRRRNQRNGYFRFNFQFPISNFR